MYHLTLTENQTRIRVLLQHLSQARRDPRRWLRLGDVETVLERTEDPETFRSMLLVTTHLEDIIESDTEISYPLWSAMRLPYVITNGPGRKCTAAEMVDAPIWDSELNWMDVLGHLSKLIPAVRECAVGTNLKKVDRINARLATELTPLLFEMNAVAPVLVGEVERLLHMDAAAAGEHDAAAEETAATASQQQEISQAEVAQALVQQPTVAASSSKTLATDETDVEQQSETVEIVKTKKTRVARKTKAAKTRSTEKMTGARKTPVARTVTASKKKKKTASANKTVSSAKSASKTKKTANAESERRALAVGIADADAANDQYGRQLAIPLFA